MTGLIELKFKQENATTTADADPLKTKLKEYFKNIETSMSNIEIDFNKNYQFCANHLKAYNLTCETHVEEIKQNINFNKKYSDSLNKVNIGYDELINKYYDANMLSIASNICDLTEKNDIVETYAKVIKTIDGHFNIFKSEEMSKVLTQVNIKQKDNVNAFLEAVVDEYGVDEKKDDFMHNRQTLAQILFNKVSTYMTNSIQRKSKVLEKSKVLFQNLKNNDELVNKKIEELKQTRKQNSELAYNLNRDNRVNLKQFKTCENLSILNSKCEETANLYKSVLKSYVNQSDALTNIYNFIAQK